jgi:Domain of unknown function (DUF4270)
MAILRASEKSVTHKLTTCENRFYLLIKTMVKSPALVLSIATCFLTSAFFLSSCKKLNQATELGDKLLPAVDNVHTFEVALDAVTVNRLFDDTTKVQYGDFLALGDIDDPEFGHTHANIDFSVSPSAFGSYPFVARDSLNIDSVVLSLSYVAAFGDTVNNGVQTVHVFEIAQNSGFNDTTLYRYTDPSSDFPTVGPELGSATFTIKNLKDTVSVIRGSDTALMSHVVRIRLDDLFGQRLAQYDTSIAYKSDSLFRTLFAGFAIKADAGGNALSYLNLADIANSRMTVYYRYGKNDTSSFDFIHAANGQSNFIDRQNGGNYLTYLNNGAGDKVYLQSAPGSFVNVRIPALDTFSNKVIHRAEIVAVKIPSAGDDVFSVPAQLMLDRKNRVAPDTVFMLSNDLVATTTGTVGFSTFGGSLLKDNTFRFNISRYVQSIITRHEPNDTLRIYAPLRTTVFNSNLNSSLSIKVLDAIAKGRVVLGGGSFADPSMKLRLRIIYSNL